MRVTGIIFFALSLLFFSGCSSTSNQMNQSSLQDELIIYGITLGSTKDDVVDKFGVPTTKKQRDKVIQYKYKDYDFCLRMIQSFRLLLGILNLNLIEDRYWEHLPGGY
ncbi:hypothetical protein [Brevibacillus parabrevis]|uniref:hypothetical protein n=1 Tax=Brevibacillus parabrevis TaxID=54914 RepID=UPI001F60A1A6|nr:hypothetical protein [Brevibacillus parabrevis]